MCYFFSRNVKLKNCEALTENGLKVLQGHKVEQFDCCGMKFDIHDIIGTVHSYFNSY